MMTFILTQLVGIILFVTFNYAILSYIRYRKNQLGKEAPLGQRFILQNLTAAMYGVMVLGVSYRVAVINQHLNIDYPFIVLDALIKMNNISVLAI